LSEYQPKITLEEGIPGCVAWLEEHGLLEDSRADETEDRIIGSVDQLYASLGVAR